MAHVNDMPVDFTHPIKRNGSINVAVKQALTQCYRALGGKHVQAGNPTAFAATTVVPIPTLTFKVRKGKQYRITGTLLTTSDGTSGIKVGMALTGSSAATGTIVYGYKTAAAIANQAVSSNALNSNSTGVAAAELLIDIDGYFIPDVSGFLTVSVGTFTGTTGGTVNAGSAISVYRTYS